MFKNKSFIISIILSSIFLSCGFKLLHYGLVGYENAFFVLLPIVVGLSIGALPRKGWALFGLCLTLISFIAGSIMLGLEGAVCGLMALGILLPQLFLGAVIVHLTKRKGTNDLKLLSAPFLLFLLAAPVKNLLVGSSETIETKTEKILSYS